MSRPTNIMSRKPDRLSRYLYVVYRQPDKRLRHLDHLKVSITVQAAKRSI